MGLNGSAAFYLAVFNLAIAVYLYRSFPIRKEGVGQIVSLQVTPMSDLQ